MSTPLVQEKTYLITRRADDSVEARVVAPFKSELLIPRWDIARCSDKFDTGNGTNGSKQLAIAILADAFGPEDARLLFEGFTNEVIAKLVVGPGVSTKITFRDVLSWKHNPAAAR